MWISQFDGFNFERLNLVMITTNTDRFNRYDKNRPLIQKRAIIWLKERNIKIICSDVEYGRKMLSALYIETAGGTLMVAALLRRIEHDTYVYSQCKCCYVQRCWLSRSWSTWIKLSTHSWTRQKSLSCTCAFHFTTQTKLQRKKI